MPLNSSSLSSQILQLPEGDCLEILYHLPLSPSLTAPTVIFLPYWGGTARTFTLELTKLASTSPSTTCIAISYSGTGKTLLSNANRKVAARLSLSAFGFT